MPVEAVVIDSRRPGLPG